MKKLKYIFIVMVLFVLTSCSDGAITGILSDVVNAQETVDTHSICFQSYLIIMLLIDN